MEAAASDLRRFLVDAIVRFVFHLSSKRLLLPPIEMTDRALFSSQALFFFKNADGEQDEFQ